MRLSNVYLTQRLAQGTACGTRGDFGTGALRCAIPTAVLLSNLCADSNACAGQQTPQTYRLPSRVTRVPTTTRTPASGLLGTGEQARWISAPKPGCSATLRLSSSGPEQTHTGAHSNQTPAPGDGHRSTSELAAAGGRRVVRSSRTPPVSDMTHSA